MLIILHDNKKLCLLYHKTLLSYIKCDKNIELADEIYDLFKNIFKENKKQR